MGKWGGRGIPPTRRKIHRLRVARIKADKQEAVDRRSDAAYRDYTWSRRVRRTIVNPERFEELWISPEEGS